MLEVESSRVFVAPGETVVMRMPYSEVMMHLGLAGKLHAVRLQASRTMAGDVVPGEYVAQLMRNGREYSIPVLTAEAGFIQGSGNVFWYYED